MMKSNEVSTATLEQLTNELAAAGWDSTQTNIEDAREAVLNLIADTGFESCKQGEPREDNPYHIDAFSRDAWFAGWDDAI